MVCSMALGESDRPLRKDAARNRERILDAARELFAERGLSVTLNDVAHHAGVGVGTVYRRFADKAELIDALFEQRIDELVRAMSAAITEPDPWRGLTGFLEHALELQARDLALKDLVLGAPGQPNRVAHARSQLMPLAARLFQRLRESGQLRPGIEPQDIALLQLMVGSVIDVAHDTAPELWRRYLAILLDGLRADPGERGPLPAPPVPIERLDEVMGRWRAPRGRRQGGSSVSR
jgi:AcrR family transcriptional regulator